MFRALEIPGNIDLSSLSYFMYSQRIPHKISEESGRQVIWTADAEQGDLVRELYERWQSGELELTQAPPRRGLNPSGVFKNIPWRQFPFTMGFMLICLVVAAITQLGSDWAMISKFSFAPFKLAGNYIYFGSLSMTLDQGEYWRLLTPIFIHFGLPHLTFNMLSLFIFGSRLEARQGGLHLLGIILFSGLLSNFAQYYWGGEDAIFGGFSGVVYGLMGYCMIREKFEPDWQLGLPPMFYGFMLLWLLIGYTGVLGAIGFGNMANAAHSGGLAAGVLLGALSSLLSIRKS